MISSRVEAESRKTATEVESVPNKALADLQQQDAYAVPSNWKDRCLMPSIG